MATDLIEINPDEPQPEALERAAAAVRRGEVVAIPTDALYTLVADPLNLHAVAGVFAAKGREIASLPADSDQRHRHGRGTGQRTDHSLLHSGAPLSGPVR